jgi:hypothetical protein
MASNPVLMRRTLRFLSKYPSYQEDAIPRFKRDAKLTTRRRIKEIGRSTKPLLNWAQQVDLLEIDPNGWCFVTEKGSTVQNFYSSLFPLWFGQLGFDPAYPSSLLLLYNYAYLRKIRINPSRLPTKARKKLRALNSKFHLWNQQLTKLKQPLDFDLNYDVPQEWRKSVLSHFENLRRLVTKKKIDIHELSLWPLPQLEGKLGNTSMERYQKELSRAIGFSIPRRECFQTGFEWQTCIKLRILKLPAIPYQGEFEGETDLPMAANSPDVVIRNTIKSLVECKSQAEWGKLIRLNKRVGGEIQMYQSYAEEVNANSALFVCEGEGFDEKRFIRSFVTLGNKLDKIVMLTWSYLDRAQQDRKLMVRFLSAIRAPESVDPDKRILA